MSDQAANAHRLQIFAKFAKPLRAAGDSPRAASLNGGTVRAAAIAP
ncbi:MAG: hypothetical protein ACR2KT_06020 [Methylocella sp.]